MNELEGTLEASGSVAIVVSRYHGRITRNLLEGARAACIEAGVPDSDVDILWVDGAFELGVVTASAAKSDRYTAIVAIGVVVRGETPHFDFVAGETAASLARIAAESLVPVGLGLLTCDDIEQAAARAGGSAGNKGREAAEAAIRTASLLTKMSAQ
jgi:6,7-dimethyl-8-ribityllumazine synthase